MLVGWIVCWFSTPMVRRCLMRKQKEMMQSDEYNDNDDDDDSYVCAIAV